MVCLLFMLSMGNTLGLNGIEREETIDVSCKPSPGLQRTRVGGLTSQYGLVWSDCMVVCNYVCTLFSVLIMF